MVCLHKLSFVGVDEREKDIEGEGCQQETCTSRSDSMSLVRGDIHLACVCCELSA